MNLEQWQSRNQISNARVAHLLKVHPSLISHIKAGRRNWSPKLAEAMEILSGGQLHRLDLLYPNHTETPNKKSIINRIRKLFTREKHLAKTP